MQKNTLLQQRAASALVGVRQYRLSLIERLAEGMVQRLKMQPDTKSALSMLEQDERNDALYGDALLSMFSDLLKPKGFLSWFGVNASLSDDICDRAGTLVRSLGKAGKLTVEKAAPSAGGPVLARLLDQLRTAPLALFEMDSGHVNSKALDNIIDDLRRESWAGGWVCGVRLVAALASAEQQLIALSDLLSSQQITVNRRARELTVDGRRYRREEWASLHDDDLMLYWLWFYLLDDTDTAYTADYEETFAAEDLMAQDDDTTRRYAPQPGEGEYGDGASEDGLQHEDAFSGDNADNAIGAAAVGVGAAVAADAALDHANLGSFS